MLKTREYWLINIQNDIFNLVNDYKKEHQLSQTELAQQLGLTKANVSGILNGSFDLKISRLVSLALTLNRAPLISFINLKDIISDEEKGLNWREAGLKHDAHTGRWDQPQSSLDIWYGHKFDGEKTYGWQVRVK